MYIFFWVL